MTPTQICARALADSVSSSGVRLTTMELVFPRCVLAEFNTHRALSRNSASSRAVPVERMLARVEEDPFVPSHWTTAQRGMVGGPALEGASAEECAAEWLRARDRAVESARALLRLGLHKQVVNRVLEPFMWHTALASATEWGNFLALRDSAEAEPHFRDLAREVGRVLERSRPGAVEDGGWHLPFSSVLPEGVEDQDTVLAVCTARCARVSYLNHEGGSSLSEDVAMYARLRANGHWSPFEHPARATGGRERIGNFVGWRQHRKDFADEERQHPLAPRHAGGPS